MKKNQRTRKNPAKITQEIYDRAWAIWQKDQNVEELVRQLGLHRTTCDKLANIGYPAAGFVALRHRLLDIREVAQRRANYRMVNLQADNIGRLVESINVSHSVRSVIAKQIDKYVNAANADELPEEIKNMTLQELMALKCVADSDIRKEIELAAFLLNGGSSKVTVNQSDPILEILVTECAGKTREEKEFYLKHRRWPEADEVGDCSTERYGHGDTT
jgi:hypothetical protein